MGVLKSSLKNRKCDGTQTIAHYRHNPTLAEYLKEVGPSRLSAYLPVGLHRASNGPLLEECLLPAVHEAMLSISK